MPRFLRLLLLPSLLAGALLAAPAPARATFAGCSSDSSQPGVLFVQAGFGQAPSILMRFYISGPETHTVYEGHNAEMISRTFTGLTPGTYRWMLYEEQDGNRQTTTLATCTVYGLINVPSVKGQSKASAQSELEGAGLALGSVGSAYSSSVTAGLVLSQSPAAGADVAPGTAVSLTLSKGPAPVVATPKPTPKATVAPSVSPTPTVSPTPDPTASPTPEISPTPVPTAAPFTTPGAGGSPTSTGETGTPATLLLGLLPLGLLLAALLLRRRR
jgi:LPXTG-motif cell wall-anchored protein